MNYKKAFLYNLNFIFISPSLKLHLICIKETINLPYLSVKFIINASVLELICQLIVSTVNPFGL